MGAANREGQLGTTNKDAPTPFCRRRIGYCIGCMCQFAGTLASVEPEATAIPEFAGSFWILCRVAAPWCSHPSDEDLALGTLGRVDLNVAVSGYSYSGIAIASANYFDPESTKRCLSFVMSFQGSRERRLLHCAKSATRKRGVCSDFNSLHKRGIATGRPSRARGE